MASIHFSTNRLDSADWQRGVFDISWARLIDSDQGVLSPRYANAFFPELKADIEEYREQAKTLYRTLSEFVHGNQYTGNSLRQALSITKRVKTPGPCTISRWARYLPLLYVLGTVESWSHTLSKVECSLSDRLGHLHDVRSLLAGG